MPSEGIDLIAAERQRQVVEESWTADRDDEHTDGELALAAVCYATPSALLVADKRANQIIYSDPWPWEDKWDKRLQYGERRVNPGNVVPDPSTYTDEENFDLLVKAGALIAAEIDRLHRAKENPK